MRTMKDNASKLQRTPGIQQANNGGQRKAGASSMIKDNTNIIIDVKSISKPMIPIKMNIVVNDQCICK